MLHQNVIFQHHVDDYNPLLPSEKVTGKEPEENSNSYEKDIENNLEDEKKKQFIDDIKTTENDIKQTNDNIPLFDSVAMENIVAKFWYSFNNENTPIEILMDIILRYFNYLMLDQFQN